MKKTIRTNYGTPPSRPIRAAGTNTAVPESRSSLAQIEAALEGAGLVVLGAFHPGPEDGVPAYSAQHGTATIVLGGNGGGAMWPFFEAYARHGENPLNAWSSDLFGRLAAQFGARAASPADGPPFHPFQRWALKSGQVFASPVGILIHPEYGLWHSYRGALLFAERLDLPAAVTRANPCDACREKPCLSACPVDAFQPGIYDVKRCAGHIGGNKNAGKPNDCRMTGCRARHACPVGQKHAYPPAQAQFHMAAFIGKHGTRDKS